MSKILVSGCLGAMGSTVVQAVRKENGCTLAGGFDLASSKQSDFPIFASPADCAGVDFDVVIDFSSPRTLPALEEIARRKGCGLVLATTGYTEEQLSRIDALSREVPVLLSANMSLGIALLRQLCMKAAQTLRGFDIEIIEKHHNRKVDAPSGTALLLANSIRDVLPSEVRYTYDRHSRRQKREPDEIGIHSMRGGSIPGEHEVIFAGPQEVISLSHTAYSRELFATGAVSAAKFLAGKPAGMYTMEQLIEAIAP